MIKIASGEIKFISGIAVGVVVADAVSGGWAAMALLFVGILGRWILSQLAGAVLGEEIQQLRELIKLKDPIKIAIWQHKNDNHAGSFKTCPECTLKLNKQ